MQDGERGYGPAMVLATVSVWHEDEGWGILHSSETPGGCWAHFSSIDMPGYKSLTAGQTVELDWEVPAGSDYEGYRFFAARVKP